MTVVVAMLSCGETPKSNEAVEPMYIEFWEVCDNGMSVDIENFLYEEVDALVCASHDADGEDIGYRPFSSLLSDDKSYLMGGIVAAAKKENISALNDFMAMDSVQQRLDEITGGEVKLSWEIKSRCNAAADDVFRLYALRGHNGLNPVLDSSCLVKAEAEKSFYGNDYTVLLTMSEEAAVLWADITERNIGKSIAMVGNGRVLSCPWVNGRIDGGKSSISGNFTKEEAERLARAINVK